ncbi:MAG: MFS transporter, partial [Ilumatobacteraceae bacterium]
HWALILAVVSAAIAVFVAADLAVSTAIVGGLVLFGAVFAMNSSLHSFLVLAFSDDDDVALDVGFYYSANAAGRFVGTFLSGVLYLWGDLAGALWGSTVFVVLTWLLTLRLPPMPENSSISFASVDGGD